MKHQLNMVNSKRSTNHLNRKIKEKKYETPVKYSQHNKALHHMSDRDGNTEKIVNGIQSKTPTNEQKQHSCSFMINLSINISKMIWRGRSAQIIILWNQHHRTFQNHVKSAYERKQEVILTPQRLIRIKFNCTNVGVGSEQSKRPAITT